MKAIYAVSTQHENKLVYGTVERKESGEYIRYEITSRMGDVVICSEDTIDCLIAALIAVRKPKAF